jgi:hypothetical protein
MFRVFACPAERSEAAYSKFWSRFVGDKLQRIDGEIIDE